MNALRNYRTFLDNMAKVAENCGRNAGDISLVIVSKGHAWDEILPIYNAGHRAFGENRLQEALPKISSAPSDVQWHMIGSLQKNKARRAVSLFSLIHSVDTPELLNKIAECSSEAGMAAKVLLQVNVSGEAAKHGLSAEEWKKHVKMLMNLSAVNVQGLMTMAPFVEDEKTIRSAFSGLRAFRDELRVISGGVLELPHLSMGMTHDYKIAIEEGATILRIGSAIFD